MSIIDKIKSLFSSKPDLIPTVSFSEAIHSHNSFEPRAAAKKIKTTVAAERFYPLLIILLIALFSADLTILYVRDIFLPQSAPPSFSGVPQGGLAKIRSEYGPITDRNIFNSDGIIPNPVSGGEGTAVADDGPAIKSSLPLTLIGTIVHANPGKSVATIQVKTSNEVVPFVANDEIDSIAYLVKVERRKAIIRNLNTNGLEYIEIPEDAKLTFGKKAAPTEASTFQREGNNFSVTRDQLNGYLKDLPNLLQQATAVPNIVPGSGGEVDGFKMIAIEPGSVFTQIGLQTGDVIKGVNGEKVNSPAKAMELYNSLRNEGKIELEVERNGRTESLNFSVTN